MPEFLVYIIGIGVCIFALLTVTSRNVFHCAIWLSLTLLGVSSIYFYLNADFLGVIQILVYIGGIITLFVFAIKLTANIGDKSIQQTNQQVIPSALAASAFLIILLLIISAGPWAGRHPNAGSMSLNSIGESLLTTYALPFEFISLVLLAATVGAIVIGKGKK